MQHLTENGWTDGIFGNLESNRTQTVVCSVIHIGFCHIWEFSISNGEVAPAARNNMEHLWIMSFCRAEVAATQGSFSVTI